MEKRRADFRSAHLDFYSSANPNGDASDIIDKAHAETIDAQNQLGIEIARRDSLVAQLRRVSPTLRVEAAPSIIVNDRNGAQTDLTQATAALASLQSRFTDSHPDVIAQKNLVERLKAQQKDGESGSGSASYQGRQSISNPVYVNLQSKVADAETSVALQRRRLEQAQANEQKARGDMSQALTVSRQYADLDRDYAVIHKNYMDLVARREAAKLSRAVGEQESDTVFRVIEPPQTPERPVSPNRLLLNSLVLMIGLFAGMALAFVLHANRDSFSVSDQLQESFDLPVLGTISEVHALSHQVQARRALATMGASLAAMLSIYAGLALISYTNIMATIRGLL
jgi:polysaccharide chain length determinant protein (PEP-CTERM system associated)